MVVIQGNAEPLLLLLNIIREYKLLKSSSGVYYIYIVDNPGTVIRFMV